MRVFATATRPCGRGVPGRDYSEQDDDHATDRGDELKARGEGVLSGRQQRASAVGRQLSGDCRRATKRMPLGPRCRGHSRPLTAARRAILGTDGIRSRPLAAMSGPAIPGGLPGLGRRR